MNKKLLCSIICLVLSTDLYALGGRSSSSSSSSSSSKSSGSSSNRVTGISSKSSSKTSSMFSSSSSTRSAASGSVSSDSIARTSSKPSKLFESFASRNKPLIDNKKSINQNDVVKAFDPSYKIQRRHEYYSNYTPSYTPPSPSYGMWDFLMLQSVLDNVGDRQMYYHHQNDPDIQRWRNDIEKECKAGNQSICDKLRDLDNEMQQIKNKGVAPNAKYVTPGIDPDIYEANNIDISALKQIKVCTGSVGSDYSRYLAQIANLTKIPVHSIVGNGSADNLSKLSTGECDLAFVQEDLVATDNLIKLVTVSKPQVAALICGNKTGIKNIKDVSKSTTIHIGVDQTGSEWTFREFIKKRNIPQLVDNIVVDKPITQLAKDITPSECLFTVATPDAHYINILDTRLDFRIVPLESDDVSKTNYRSIFIDGSGYNHLVTKKYSGMDSWLNWFSKHGFNTFQVKTVLIAPKTWTEQNRQLYDLLLLESSKLEQVLK